MRMQFLGYASSARLELPTDAIAQELDSPDFCRMRIDANNILPTFIGSAIGPERTNWELGATMARRTVRTAGRTLSLIFLALLASGTYGNAQQTTGQLLISSGFNPIAAT